MFDAVCVGILVADVIAKPIDTIPQRGKLGLIDKCELYTGGCAVNASIDMSRLGLSAAIIGKIGSDGFGSFMLGALKKEGVDVSGLAQSTTAGTSASVVLSDSSGERTFLHCLGANAEFDDSDVNYDIIANSNIVFVAGSLLMSSFDGEACARVLKRSKEMNKVTVLDTAWDSRGNWMKLIGPSMPHLDFFMPSYEEAVQLAGGKTDPEAIADEFIGMGVKTAVIKLGKDGCFIKDSITGQKHRIPTFSGFKPVDTTGAGDSFCAGFITGLIKGFDLYESGVFANAVGTHCVMAMGASSGVKNFGDTMRFIRENPIG